MDSDSSMLMLTNGEQYQDGQNPSHTQDTVGSEDEDSDTDDIDFNDNAETSSLSGESSREEEDGEERDTDDDENMKDVAGEEGDDLDEEARDLAVEIAALDEDGPSRRPSRRSFQPFQPFQPSWPSQPLNLDAVDKLSALRSAFPDAPVDISEKVLAASKGNLKTTYNVLSEGFNPIMSLEAVIARHQECSNPAGVLYQSRALANSKSTHGIASRPSTEKWKPREQSPAAPPSEDPGNDLDEEDEAEERTLLIKKYGS
jgi:hypothetical protein